MSISNRQNIFRSQVSKTRKWASDTDETECTADLAGVESTVARFAGLIAAAWQQTTLNFRSTLHSSSISKWQQFLNGTSAHYGLFSIKKDK